MRAIQAFAPPAVNAVRASRPTSRRGGRPGAQYLVGVSELRPRGPNAVFDAGVFVSGAAVLALELLASRILTPYFGVSLTIWAGILATTLVALALGYRLGGGLAVRAAGDTAGLALRFAALPAFAAFGVIAACLVYPELFARLAAAHLVLGAFAGCAVLLLAPLVALAAMSPLWVALR